MCHSSKDGFADHKAQAHAARGAGSAYCATLDAGLSGGGVDGVSDSPLGRNRLKGVGLLRMLTGSFHSDAVPPARLISQKGIRDHICRVSCCGISQDPVEPHRLGSGHKDRTSELSRSLLLSLLPPMAASSHLIWTPGRCNDAASMVPIGWFNHGIRCQGLILGLDGPRYPTSGVAAEGALKWKVVRSRRSDSYYARTTLDSRTLAELVKAGGAVSQRTSRYGVSKKLTENRRGPEFVGDFWLTLCYLRKSQRC
jgi:hypothetical protein